MSSAKVKERWERSARGNPGSCSGDVQSQKYGLRKGGALLLNAGVTHAPEKKVASPLNSQFKEQLSSAIADSWECTPDKDTIVR